MNVERVRAAYGEACALAGPRVTVVAATKYVSVADMALLVDAGVEVVGENRAQDLVAKYAVYGDVFRWHFIGRIQSNKAKVVDRICERVHAVETESTALRLTVPWLVEVNLAGEESKGGIAPEAIKGWVERHPSLVGLMAMPPLTRDPEASRPFFRRLRELATAHGLHEVSMGTSQDWRVAVEEGATHVRIGAALWS